MVLVINGLGQFPLRPAPEKVPPNVVTVRLVNKLEIPVDGVTFHAVVDGEVVGTAVTAGGGIARVPIGGRPSADVLPVASSSMASIPREAKNVLAAPASRRVSPVVFTWVPITEAMRSAKGISPIPALVAGFGFVILVSLLT